MSYDITIGEAIRVAPWDAPEGTPPTRPPITAADAVLGALLEDADVAVLELPDAPLFRGDEDTTGRTNIRRPGYRQWAVVLEEAGLSDLFFNRAHGLMRQHPGTVVLGEKHLALVKMAAARLRSRSREPGVEPDINGSSIAATLVRVEWLAWWIRRALDTCTVPVIHNT